MWNNKRSANGVHAALLMRTASNSEVFHTVIRVSKISSYVIVLLTLTSCINNARFSAIEPVLRAKSTDVSQIEADYHQESKSTSTPAFYLVKPGDTLYSIAFRFGLDYKKLAYANNIDKQYRIYEGQSLALKEVEKPVIKATNRSNTHSPVQQVQSSKSDTKVNSQNTDNGNVAKTSTVNVNVTWKWPHDGKIVRTFSLNVSGNKGIDLSGRIGDSVNAATNGVVVYAGNGLPGYGNLIILEHSNGLLSAYAFNEQILVKEKEQVRVGQKIATMGKQGDQPGLHFEIRQNGKPINPLKFLPKR